MERREAQGLEVSLPSRSRARDGSASPCGAPSNAADPPRRAAIRLRAWLPCYQGVHAAACRGSAQLRCGIARGPRLARNRRAGFRAQHRCLAVRPRFRAPSPHRPMPQATSPRSGRGRVHPGRPGACVRHTRAVAALHSTSRTPPEAPLTNEVIGIYT